VSESGKDKKRLRKKCKGKIHRKGYESPVAKKT